MGQWLTHSETCFVSFSPQEAICCPELYDTQLSMTEPVLVPRTHFQVGVFHITTHFSYMETHYVFDKCRFS